MSKFRPYTQYKSSGVEWLDKIPAHWKPQKVSQVSNITVGWTPPTGNAEYFVGDNLWANISDLGPRVLVDTAKRISDDAVRFSRIKKSSKGSLLFSFKLSVGMVSFAGRDLYTNEAIATFLPTKEVSLQYAYYAYPLFITENAGENIYGAKILNQERIRGSRIFLPPLPEQVSIANFLDHETAKIDSFIHDQEELVELLKERRSATITHAVTSGLDSKAAMKDTGLSWFSRTPEHWAVGNIKYFTQRITDGAHISPETDGGIYPFVSTRDISESGIDFEGALKTSPSTYDYMVKSGCQPQEGDVLFSKDGTVGKTAVVMDTAPFVVASSLIIIRPNSSHVHPRFLDYLCRSSGVQEQVRSFVKGAGLPRLSIANLLKVVGVFPPLSEQQLIVSYLDREIAECNAAMADAQEAISLSKERRAALISAAVTGRIDVRNWREATERELESHGVA